MPRKNNDNNPLEIRVHAKSLPRVRPADYFRRLMQVITDGRPLPVAWNIELQWRNPGTKHGLTKRWRSDDFESAVSESSDGFNSILVDALSQMIRRTKALPLPKKRPSKKRIKKHAKRHPKNKTARKVRKKKRV